MKLSKRMSLKNSIAKLALGLLLVCSSTFAFAENVFPFTLKNSDAKEITYSPKEDEVTVLEWFNKGCPFVKKFYGSQFMQSLQEKYTKDKVKWFTINSTKNDHSDYIPEIDRPELNSEMKFKNTDTLYDESGIFGKTVGAKTTPHIFIFKGQDLVFSGAVDDSPDSDTDPKASTNNIESVLNAILKGETSPISKTRPYGCSIKYAD